MSKLNEQLERNAVRNARIDEFNAYWSTIIANIAMLTE
jgi:hypothetical protein